MFILSKPSASIHAQIEAYLEESFLSSYYSFLMEPVNQDAKHTLPHLILVSASPQRKTLLEQGGFPFSVYPVFIEESAPENSSPEERACIIARKKVEELLKKAPEYRNSWVLGADTFLSFEERYIGKPLDESAAAELLRSLAGRTHRVITGIALFVPCSPRISCPSRADSSSNTPEKGGTGATIDTVFSITEVKFAHLEEKEIQWYVSTGEWKGAAGGYKIQGAGGLFVSTISGSYSNVVGLPLHELYGILRANRYFYRKSSGGMDP